MHKAVFFDRDGVLNKERKDYVKTVKELEIFENIGNVNAEVDLKKSAGMISGSFVLETDQKKKIDDVEEVIVSLFGE